MNEDKQIPPDASPFVDELLRRFFEMKGRWISESPTEVIYVYTAEEILTWIYEAREAWNA